MVTVKGIKVHKYTDHCTDELGWHNKGDQHSITIQDIDSGNTMTVLVKALADAVLKHRICVVNMRLDDRNQFRFRHKNQNNYKIISNTTIRQELNIEYKTQFIEKLTKAENCDAIIHAILNKAHALFLKGTFLQLNDDSTYIPIYTIYKPRIWTDIDQFGYIDENINGEDLHYQGNVFEIPGSTDVLSFINVEHVISNEKNQYNGYIDQRIELLEWKDDKYTVKKQIYKVINEKANNKKFKYSGKIELDSRGLIYHANLDCICYLVKVVADSYEHYEKDKVTRTENSIIPINIILR